MYPTLHTDMYPVVQTNTHALMAIESRMLALAEYGIHLPAVVHTEDRALVRTGSQMRAMMVSTGHDIVAA
jgi:hypothetical protein